MTTRTELCLAGIAACAMVLGLAGGCSQPPPTSPPTSQATVNVADGDVTANVKTALLQDTALKSFDINVVTVNGDVRLIGVLDNQAQIDTAIKLARAADGAHSIHDELTLKK